MPTPAVTQLSVLLSAHRGRERAITIDAIQSRLGMRSRRETEQLIEDGLEALPFPLVACGQGLFVPVTADEINAYVESLESRHKHLWRRLSIVTDKATRAGFARFGKAFTDANPQQELFA